MKISYISIQGKEQRNEDRVENHFFDSSHYAIALADGMGGKSLGEEASTIVCKSIIEYLHRNNWDENLLRKALEYSDIQLSAEVEIRKQAMGTAVLAAIVTKDEIQFVWQGNVRLYLLRNGRLSCLTTDHIIDIGGGEQRLTRCVKGCGLRDDIPCKHQRIESDDTIFMCTDGFYRNYQHLLTENLSISDISLFLDSPEDDATLVRIDFIGENEL